MSSIEWRSSTEFAFTRKVTGKGVILYLFKRTSKGGVLFRIVFKPKRARELEEIWSDYIDEEDFNSFLNALLGLGLRHDDVNSILVRLERDIKRLRELLSG